MQQRSLSHAKPWIYAAQLPWVLGLAALAGCGSTGGPTGGTCGYGSAMPGGITDTRIEPTSAQSPVAGGQPCHRVDYSAAPGSASQFLAFDAAQHLYITSNNRLWQRGAIGPGTGNDWTEVGDAYAVTAMASFNGFLYVISNNHLWRRGQIGPGTGSDWTDVGEAYAVTAMASFNGSLYVTSNNHLWKRGAIGPRTGNDWTEAGEAYSVTAMASFNDSLYVTSGKYLWKRGFIGPGTGNDWLEVGEAHAVTAMTSL